MFENQPKGLWTLAIANTGERFGYYTMLMVFTLFLKDNFAFTEGTAGVIYSSDSKYTSLILLKAIQSALDKATPSAVTTPDVSGTDVN